VACMEWNDLPFGETVFGNTYQTSAGDALELLEPDLFTSTSAKTAR